MAKRKPKPRQAFEPAPQFLPAYGIIIYYGGGAGYLKKTLLGWGVTQDKEAAWHTAYGHSANYDAEDLLRQIHRGEVVVDAPGPVSYGNVIPIAKMAVSTGETSVGVAKGQNKCGFVRRFFGMCPTKNHIGGMKRYTSSFAASRSLRHEHPERTAMRDSGEWDVEFQVWPSRDAMLTTIQMQAKRAPNRRDWKPLMA